MTQNHTIAWTAAVKYPMSFSSNLKIIWERMLTVGYSTAHLNKFYRMFNDKREHLHLDVIFIVEISARSYSSSSAVEKVVRCTLSSMELVRWISFESLNGVYVWSNHVVWF